MTTSSALASAPASVPASAFSSSRATSIVLQMSIPQSAPAASMLTAHSIEAPAIGTIDHNQRVDQLRGLATSVTEEDASPKSNDVTSLRTAATRAQAEALNLMKMAAELTRQADDLEKKLTGQDVNALLPGQSKIGRQVRRRLKKIVARGKKMAMPIHDPMASTKLRKKGLQEIDDSLASARTNSMMARNKNEGPPPKRSTQQQMQTVTDRDTDTDTDTEELQILDDNAEVRALFEKKAEEPGGAMPHVESQDDAHLIPNEYGLLAKRKTLTELQESATIPVCLRRDVDQQIQPESDAGLLKQIAEQDSPSKGYRPTACDMALGLKWTLLSSETVRKDLDRELREGGNQRYVAGHIAIMRRKACILQYFGQECDAPVNLINKELMALLNALSVAEPLVKPESVLAADNMLRDTDYRNELHLTIRHAGAQALAMAMNRKRKYEATDAQLRGSGPNTIGLPVKRRCMEHQQSYRPETLHAQDQGRKPRTPVQPIHLERTQDLGLPGSRYTIDSDGSESMEVESDMDVCESS